MALPQATTLGASSNTPSQSQPATVKVSPAEVAAEVAKLGGSVMQQYVAAALVSGVESSGISTEPAGGVGPAAGLFQYEPETWLSNGGGQYANNAQDATWQEQVAVFVNQTAGDHFGAWGPDLVANSGNPNNPSNASYGYSGAPQVGSRVYNVIKSLPGGGAALAGSNAPYPTTGADAGGVVPASPTPIPGLGGTSNGPSGVNVGGQYSSWEDAITGVLSALSGGFGIGWKAVLTIIGGILLIGVGILVLLRHQAGEAASLAALP